MRSKKSIWEISDTPNVRVSSLRKAGKTAINYDFTRRGGPALIFTGSPITPKPRSMVPGTCEKLEELMNASTEFDKLRNLSPRQRREVEFYEEFCRQTLVRVNVSKFVEMPTSARNSGLYFRKLVLQTFQSPAQRLLDFGCGPGMHSVGYAHIGYDVHGFDICPSNIEIAKALSEKHGVHERTRFSVQACEHLEYPTAFFDVVAGINILHHVEIVPSVAECLRVLKDDGIAIFQEHAESPIVDRIRNTRIVKSLFPNEMSIAKQITHDERKLSKDDLLAIRELCPNMVVKRFGLFRRLKRISRRLYSYSTTIDESVLRFCPFLRVFGADIVIVLRKCQSPVGD